MTERFRSTKLSLLKNITWHLPPKNKKKKLHYIIIKINKHKLSLIQDGTLSKSRLYAPEKTRISVYFSSFYSFILCGSLKLQFTFTSTLTEPLFYRRHILRITTFSFHTDYGNSLLRNLNLLKLHDILESDNTIFCLNVFYKWAARISVQSIRSSCNNSLTYIPTMSTTHYGNMLLRGDGVF